MSEVISSEECAELLHCTVERRQRGRGRRTPTGPFPEDPVYLPGQSKPLPRLIRAEQAAALKCIELHEFVRLARFGLTPPAVARPARGAADRWHLDDIVRWAPYKVSRQDGTSRQRLQPLDRREEGLLVNPPKPIPLAPGAHHLYRHFGADGRLLYVGVSLSAVARLSDHAQTAPWFWQIARIEVTAYASERDALAAERIAIYRERPLHNIRHARKTA